MKIKSELWLSGCYLAIVIITSIPFFIKHSPAYAIILMTAYAAFSVALIIFTERFDIRQIGFLNHHLPWILGVLVITSLNILLFPISRQAAHPGTAPNALTEPAIAMFQTGSNPYSVRLFDGAPISPGPGWILLNSPFALGGLITLLTPVYLTFSAAMIAKWSKAYAFVFIILLATSLCFLQMSIIGHDLPATILALVGLTLALYRYHENNIVFIVIAILTGFLATARVPFIIIPIALSICLYTINHRRAIQFALISTGLAIIIHLVFMIWAIRDGLPYQPFHIFLRASQVNQPIFLGIGAIVWIVTGWFAMRGLTKNPLSWVFFLWVILAIPFAFVGFGELISNGFFSSQAWAAWEGKGYVLFTIPLLIARITLNLAQRPRAQVQV